MKHSQTISVISEYKKLGLDFVQLLEDSILLGQLLTEADNYEKEKQKELEATQFCYNLNPNAEYKKFYDEISIQYLKARYRVKMLQLVQLLSQKYDTIDKCIEKREKLLELVGFRKKTISKIIDVRMLFDPFDRVRIKEQLDVITPFVDNSRVINRIRKEISDLNFRTEEMLRENDNYLITLSNTKELVGNRVRFSDIDIYPVMNDFDDILVRKKVEPNQVVAVRDVSIKLNMSIVIQKVNGVIVRVNKMMNQVGAKKENASSTMLTPELVIVPTISKESTGVVDDFDEKRDLIFMDRIEDISSGIDEAEQTDDEQIIDDVVDGVTEDSKISVEEIDSNLFETILPFSQPIMFSDRMDEDDMELSQSFESSETSDSSEIIDFPSLENSSFTMNAEEEDSNDFWPSQVYSDEQIGEILSLNDVGDTKVRRKAA